MRTQLKYLAASLLLLSGWAVAQDPKAPLTDRSIPNLGLIKEQIKAYVTTGRYEAEITAVTKKAEREIDTRLALKLLGKPAIVLDIDETALSNWEIEQKLDFGYYKPMYDEWEKSGTATAIKPVLELYKYARSKGVAVFFITGRRESSRESTEKNLKAVGYTEFEAVVMKPVDLTVKSAAEFKAPARLKIVDDGWRIMVNIGDQQSDLDGGYAEKTFKLPNPMYFIK